MKKDSNAGLLFLMAIGIVGLGLYYGATDNYGSWEIQVYHVICWVVLLIALLRALQLVWEPVKFFWDQAWGKVQETRNNRMKENEAPSVMVPPALDLPEISSAEKKE